MEMSHKMKYWLE